MLRYLSDFAPFSMEDFSNGKTFMATGCRPWNDFESKQVRGQKVDVVILTDETVYKPRKDGEVATNRFEKFVVKVPKTVDVPVNAMIELVNARATIYGDYRNQISVVADDIRVLPPSKS